MGDGSRPTGATGRTPERLGGAPSEHGAGCADDRTRADFGPTGHHGNFASALGAWHRGLRRDQGEAPSSRFAATISTANWPRTSVCVADGLAVTVRRGLRILSRRDLTSDRRGITAISHRGQRAMRVLHAARDARSSLGAGGGNRRGAKDLDAISTGWIRVASRVMSQIVNSRHLAPADPRPSDEVGRTGGK